MVIGDLISNDDLLFLRLVRVVEEIIENGIFYLVYVGGFLEVCIFLKGDVRIDEDINVNGKKSLEVR